MQLILLWFNKCTCGSDTTYKHSWRWTCKWPKHVEAFIKS